MPVRHSLRLAYPQALDILTRVLIIPDCNVVTWVIGASTPCQAAFQSLYMTDAVGQKVYEVDGVPFSSGERGSIKLLISLVYMADYATLLGRRFGCDSRPDFLTATCPPTYRYGAGSGINYEDIESQMDQRGYDPRAFVTDCSFTEDYYYEMPSQLPVSDLGGQDCAIGYKALAYFEAINYNAVSAGTGRLWAYSGHRASSSAGWNAVDVCAGSYSPRTFCTRYISRFPVPVQAPTHSNDYRNHPIFSAPYESTRCCQTSSVFHCGPCPRGYTGDGTFCSGQCCPRCTPHKI